MGLKKGIDLIKALKVGGAVAAMLKKRVEGGEGRIQKVTVFVEFESGQRISFDATDIMTEFVPLVEKGVQDGKGQENMGLRGTGDERGGL